MALGFGKKSDSSSPISSPSTGKATDPELLTKDGYLAADTTAAEHGGRKPRKKMNRIDGPITKPIGGENVLNDDATDSDVSIGKQMEKEAGNAIKYRTCSWQKVRYSSPVSMHSQCSRCALSRTIFLQQPLYYCCCKTNALRGDSCTCRSNGLKRNSF